MYPTMAAHLFRPTDYQAQQYSIWDMEGYGQEMRQITECQKYMTLILFLEGYLDHIIILVSKLSGQLKDLKRSTKYVHV